MKKTEKKPLSYNEAVTRLEEILARMQSADADIDTLAQDAKTARELVRFCRDRLTATAKEIDSAFGSGEQEADL